MRLNQRALLMHSVVNSESLELINSLKTSIRQSITNSSTSVKLNTLSLEIPSQSKSHPTTDLEMKLIHSATYSSYFPTNQRETFSSMLITIKRFSDSQLDSTLEFQRMSREDSLSHSSFQMILFQSLNQPKRTLV